MSDLNDLFQQQEIRWLPYEVDQRRIYLRPFYEDLSPSVKMVAIRRADAESLDHCTLLEAWRQFGFPEHFYVVDGKRWAMVRTNPEMVRSGEHLRIYKQHEAR